MNNDPYGIPTGAVPRLENAIKERIRQENIASSEKLRHEFMEAKERAVNEAVNEAIEPYSALDHQVAGGHYKNKKIQPVEYIHANNLGFLEGCIVKRITRWRDKPAESRFQDLEKIKHEIDLLIELESKQ